jgi:hypothetical protein
VNTPATVRRHIAAALESGDPPPLYLPDEEKTAYERLPAFYKNGSGYSAMMMTRPVGQRMRSKSRIVRMGTLRR